MKICIVAAGLATRLQPLTNYIPKFLINIGKQTGFVEMVRYWSEHSKDFTIIIHPKYEELTRAYFDMYFKDSGIKLTIKPCETALGTAHTIDASLGMEYEGDDILFTWCDVIPSKPIDMAELDSKISHGDGIAVFTVDNGLNRYKYHRNTLVKAEDGDVIGIYFVEAYKQAMLVGYREGQDFADVLSRFYINQFELDDIIDFGDKPKLFEVLKNADEGREFNKVEIRDDHVKKTPLNAQGAGLIRKEIEWYREVLKHDLKVKVPAIYPSLKDDAMYMDRVHGESIFKVFSKATHHEQIEIMKNVHENFKALHCRKISVPIEQLLEDVKKEACDKLLTRYDEIEAVIQAFGKNITTVNGVEIDNDPRAVIKKLYDRLELIYMNESQGLKSGVYSLIHGDLQMSNSMVNPQTLEVTFIDPRGYFGNTRNYGLADYDYAKFLYSMSGYDLFNYSTDFHIKEISDTEICFDIEKPEDKSGIAIRHSDEKVYLWLAVCWIGLAQYIKNNPIKSVAAHYHGMALATKFLNGDFEL
jgi:hypothetical protein